MLTQKFCDRQRDDSQKMPRHHFNSEYGFSASPSPTHINADAELRERRAVEVRQQLQRRELTTQHDRKVDLLNLATEEHEAVVAADVKGELAWEEAKKAEALRKTDAAAAKKRTLAALHSAQEHKRMQQDKDAQAASARAAAHLFPVP